MLYRKKKILNLHNHTTYIKYIKNILSDNYLITEKPNCFVHVSILPNNTFSVISNHKGEIKKVISLGLLKKNSSIKTYRYLHRSVTNALLKYLFRNEYGGKDTFPFYPLKLSISCKGPVSVVKKFLKYFFSRFLDVGRRRLEKKKKKISHQIINVFYKSLKSFNGCRCSKVRRKKKLGFRVFQF